MFIAQEFANFLVSREGAKPRRKAKTIPNAFCLLLVFFAPSRETNGLGIFQVPFASSTINPPVSSQISVFGVSARFRHKYVYIKISMIIALLWLNIDEPTGIPNSGIITNSKYKNEAQARILFLRRAERVINSAILTTSRYAV